MVKSTIQEELLFLSSLFSKIHKRNFGKGPGTCNTFLQGDCLYVYIRNFITPAEEVLIHQNEMNLAVQFRSSVLNEVSQEFLNAASTILGISFDQFYYDWNYDTNTGILLLVNESTIVEIEMIKEVSTLITKIGMELHKTPSKQKIVAHTQNCCIIESLGVNLPLERLLFEKKESDLLQYRLQEMKKGYIKHKESFQDVFNRLIEDFFIMLDDPNDRIFLVFCFAKV